MDLKFKDFNESLKHWKHLKLFIKVFEKLFIFEKFLQFSKFLKSFFHH